MKREEILTGLMAALANGELRNPPLRSIGQALGIEPAHILYYFGSRERLLQAVITRWDEDAMQRAANDLSLDAYADTIQHNLVIPGIVHIYLTFAAEAVDQEHPAHEFFRERFERSRRQLGEAIRKEQADGAIPSEHDANLISRLLIALADGLQLQSLVDPHVNAASDIAAMIAWLRGQ